MPRFPITILGILMLLGLQIIKTESANVTAGEIFKELIPVIKKGAGALPIPFLSNVITMWDYFENVYQAVDSASNPKISTEQKLDVLSKKAEKIEYAVRDSENNIIERIEDISDLNKFFVKQEEFAKEANHILAIYNGFLRKIETNSISINSTREALINQHLNEYPDLDERLIRVHTALYEVGEYRTDGLIYRLLGKPQYHLLLTCETWKSVQQMIFEFYRKLVEVEIKTFGLKLYLTSLQDAANPEVNTTSQAAAAVTFLNHMTYATGNITLALNRASREVRKCNPRPNRIGYEYEKFGPVFQKYLMSTYDSLESWPSDSRDRHWAMQDHCTLKALQEKGMDYSKNEFACRSRIRDCARFSENMEFNICPLNRTEDNKERYERYLYVETVGRTIFDKNHTVAPFDDKSAYSCDKTSERTPWGEISLDDKRDKSALFRCPVYLCTCADDNPKLLRYIDLRMVKADKDKVVTGVQIKPVNNIFHIVIQQGDLQPNGLVSNAEWKDVNPPPENYQESTEFFKIEYGFPNKFFLETAGGPLKNEVVTGVGFNAISMWGDYGIRIDTLSRPFDFTRGIFTANYSTRWSERNSSYIDSSTVKKIKLDKLNSPNDPQQKYENNENRDEENAFVDLTQTRLEYDFGQNILPFVDIQRVSTYPPTPLSGVGMFRRSSEGSAGYLALKLITFDFASILKIPNVTWVN